MSPAAGLIFDVVILAALGATIFYAQRLSRQFTRMQADRQAFDALIAALNAASARAEAAIRALKEAAVAGGDGLQEKINAARGLSDELEIMVQAGDNLADRLQGLAETSRKAAPRNGGAEKEEDPAEDDGLPRTGGGDLPRGGGPRSRAEKELLEALKAKQQS